VSITVIITIINISDITETQMREIVKVKVADIMPDPDQPRKTFDEAAIEELARSIEKNGLLQPITVRPDGAAYIIIAGERRFRACKLLGLEEVDVIVYTGNLAKELQLIENINRADLNPMEVAMAYQKYIDDGHTADELSEVIGKDKGQITWVLSLLKCREDIQHMVGRNQLLVSVAASMSKLSLNGQAKALRVMQTTKLTASECYKLIDKIWGEENQTDMFPGTKLGATETEARKKFETAFERACKAFQEISDLEEDNPGITAQAIADKLDITQEKVEMLYQLVGKFRKSLEYRRISQLVEA
jgi:ParB family transcriptional regulator, chromosome partitioning protein